MKKNKKDNVYIENYNEEISDEVVSSEENKRIKRRKRRKASRIINRIFGFFLATGICAGVIGLAVEYVLVCGPSTALRDTFVLTMLETRRFDFVANIFLTEEAVNEINESHSAKGLAETDTSLINITSHSVVGGTEAQTNPDGADQYGLVDEDGDGIILVDIKGKGYSGYMIVVLDPSRVFLGKPDNYEGIGRTIEELCWKYDALGGINAGGFPDDNGSGLGGLPQGLTIVDGVCYVDEWCTFAGFDSNHILHVGDMNYAVASQLGIVDGASFEPALVINGEIVSGIEVSGVNPRTAIGQRADGAVLMLVIDGRQVHSIGATYTDCANIMLSYGAVNACNMDGGSSTCMYYEGRVVNSCSAANGVCRPLPNAWLFK